MWVAGGQSREPLRCDHLSTWTADAVDPRGTARRERDPLRRRPCTAADAGMQGLGGLGFTYVGTVNPGTAANGPPPGVPPVDVGAISVVTTDGPGGSREVTVHGGNLDVVHFGAGLSQLFTGVASMDAFVHAEIGSIHLAASAAAETLPIRYAAPFPGALGENPFYAQAEVSIDGCCDDVVTVPATLNAPNAGDLTSSHAAGRLQRQRKGRRGLRHRPAERPAALGVPLARRRHRSRWRHQRKSNARQRTRPHAHRAALLLRRSASS